MDKLHKAIAKARSFLQPPIGFTWGTKIYEAEDDGSEQSKLKNEIISCGLKVINHFESGLKSVSVSPFSLDIEIYEEKIEATLALDPEQVDFLKFINAIKELINIGNSQTVIHLGNPSVRAR